MQALDSAQSQLLTAAPAYLLAALEDIVTKLELQSAFCITHPDYKPLQLPAATVARFQQLPLDIQNQYLSLRLCDFLYGIYYNGSFKAALAPDADSEVLAKRPNLANNTYLGVDLAFYDRLHENNHGQCYFDSGWLVLRQESDGSLAVSKDGLILHIEREQHLQSAQQSATVGDSVAIRMPRNQVESSYYVAIGNSGPPSSSNPDGQPQLVWVYFNISAEGAVAVMDSLTRQLNEIAIPFSFKVLYNPSDYDCYDSGLLCFDKNNYQAIRSVLESIYREHQSHFQAEVPLFTKLLAPGLALAEEPDRKFFDRDSFGRNRCRIVANGLLEARQQGDESPKSRMAAILQQFSLMGIDWQHPYLNTNSEDIYTPLIS
ncbi:MAG: T3SS effector HopA1 family protein [Prochloraceae cyanobacterium]|nr:T3SS effector HopA1 family protein [Prochloraceae cyanobacterium]